MRILKVGIAQRIKYIVELIQQISLGSKINSRNMFVFPFILSKLEIDVSDSSNVISQYSYGVFLLSLIALLSLINILGYMISYIIIQEHKEKYELKYPRLKKIIQFYKKSSMVYVSIEIILCLLCLILLISLSLMGIYGANK